MAPLAPKDAEVKVPLVSLCILMVNALQGFASKDIGFEDTTVTLDEFLVELERKTRMHVSIRDLEQLLWAANLRAEAGHFWSPKDGGEEPFQRFLQNMFHFIRLERVPLKFDREYNVITFKEGEETPNDSEAN